jgi:glycosyltransferase involved in cell wall biosynthesis
MRISAILPVFNEKERVGKIVEVLKEADFVDEAIFVDDGPRDGSFEFLKKFEHQKNKGFWAKKRNFNFH